MVARWRIEEYGSSRRKPLRQIRPFKSILDLQKWNVWHFCGGVFFCAFLINDENLC